jgi:Family of unknown function (DUF6518)
MNTTMRARGIALVFPLLGLAFGVAAALFKGEDWGVRTIVGNLSAPWLVLPFLAGWSRRSFAAAAGLGAATSVLSVVGFYTCYALVFALVSSHTLGTDVAVLAGALVAGPVYGALGYWWRSRRSLAAGLAVGAAFVGEPLAQLALWRVRQVPVGHTSVGDHPVVFALEASIGFAVCGWFLRARLAR